ncbi:MAG: hypothetical protein D6760_03875 [Deltaproteobacteria bacterium]|nr:MAG: hypothetical protein D6760_03875 [Deltaproteobacteria bacterium]
MLRLSVGGLLLAIGVIGGFVPILQGWIFILAGLSVIAPEGRRVRRLLGHLRARLEKAKARVSSEHPTGENRP